MGIALSFLFVYENLLFAILRKAENMKEVWKRMEKEIMQEELILY